MTRGVSDLNMLAATIYPTVLTPLGADMGVFALSPHVSGEYVAELIPVRCYFAARLGGSSP